MASWFGILAFRDALAAVKRTYATKATITITLTSLGSGNGRESTVIDNTITRYRDVNIRVLTKGQGGSTAFLDLFLYESLGDAVFTDGATGVDAAFTAANRLNARPIFSIRMNAANAVCGAFKLSDVTRVVPSKFGLIAINNSGAALSVTAGDHVVEFEGIY